MRKFLMLLIVTLTFNGLKSELQAQYVQANFTASDTSVFVGDTIYLTDLSTGYPVWWEWNFGDGSYSWDQNPIHVYQTSGVFSVSLFIMDVMAEFDDYLIKTNYIEVTEQTTNPLNANFSTSNTTINLGDTIQFTDLSTGDPISWLWSFGDGTIDTIQNAWHVFQIAGSYSIMLIVENNVQELDTQTMSITIVVPGTSMISPYDISGAPGDNGIVMGLNLENTESVSMIQFRVVNNSHPDILFHQGNSDFFTSRVSGYFGGASASNGLYTIHFSPSLPLGNGSIFNCSINIASTTLPGNYPLYLTDLLLVHGTGDTIPIQSGFGLVSVNGSQVLNAEFFSMNMTGNAPFAIQFNDLSTGNPVSWLWDFGDGTVDTVQNPLHIYQSGGLYSVSLQVSNGIETDTRVFEDYINILGPVTTQYYASDTVINLGDTIYFFDQSIGNPTSWYWEFGDGTSSSDQNPIHVYQDDGVYNVSLIVSNGAFSDTLFLINYIAVIFTVDANYLAYYPLNGNANDSSGNGFHGVLSGQTPTSDRFGNLNSALSFNGNSIQTTFNWSTEITDSSSFHIVVWFKPAAIQDMYVFGETSYQNATYLGMNIAGYHIRLKGGTGFGGIAYPFDGNWHMASIGTDGSNIVLSVDTWISSGTDWGPSLGSNLLIGDHGDHYFSAFNGAIDELMIFDKLLTSNELLNLFDASNPSFLADFKADYNFGFSPLSIQFTDLTSAYPDNWLWDFGDGTYSTQQNPIHTYLVNGSFDVSLIASNSNFTDTVVKTDFIVVDDYTEGDLWIHMNSYSSPPAQYYHSLSNISDSTILFFGSGETWLYDIQNKWQQLFPTNQPANRNLHAMAYIDEGKVLLYGGSVGNTETWLFVLDSLNWFEKSPLTSPPAKVAHSMAHAGNDKVLMFGGESPFNNETWIYDLSENNWQQKTNSILSPTSRGTNGISYIGEEKVIIFGGWTGNVYASDKMWLFDLSNDNWTQLSNGGPSVRDRMAMEYLGGDKLLLFGGFAGGSQGGHKNDTWIFDLSENSWTEIYPTLVPSSRAGHDMALLNRDGSADVLMFGGAISGWDEVGDTWMFVGNDIDIMLLANFSTSDTLFTIGDTINFSDLSTGSPTSWLWDFGDGSTDTTQNPEHIYQAAGTYSVSLVVSDGTSSDTLEMVDYVFVEDIIYSLPFFENFEGQPTNSGWTTSQATGSDGWVMAVEYYGAYWYPIPSSNTSIAATSNDDLCCCDASTDFLISPKLNLSGYGSVDLSFDSFFTGDYGSECFVYVSTDGTLNNLQLIQSISIPVNLSWNNITINLDSYIDSIIQLVFHHDDNSISCASGFSIDNINITGSIVSPSLLVLASISEVSCFVGSDGSADFTISGGTSPYSFIWSNGETTEDISGLVAGTYSVTVNDAGTLVVDTSFTISEPSEIFVSGIVADVSVYGGSDGSIDISVSGGTPPYSFSWSNNATTEDLFGIAAGVYDVEILDANSCMLTAIYTLTEPIDTLQTNGIIANATCNSFCNGSIDLTISGGLTPYNVLWSNGETTEDLTDLCAGNYDVIVTDASPIVVDSFNWNFVMQPYSHVITINQNVVTVNGIPIANGDYIGVFYLDGSNLVCAGYVECLNSIFAIVAFGDDNLTPQKDGFYENDSIYWKVWKSNPGVEIDMEPGYFPQNTFQGIFINGGLSVLDTLTGTFNQILGVSDTISFIITEPDVISLSETIDNTSTFGNNDGSIDISVTGGTPPYFFLWSNNATTEDLFGIAAGNYDVQITDANSCIFSATYTVIEPFDTLQANGIIANTTCNSVCNGSIDLTISGGLTPYDVLWSNGETIEDISGLCTGTYDVTVSDNSEGTPPPFNWAYVNTGVNHTVLADPAVGVFTINGLPLDSGDVIGAFYDSSGVSTCGGYLVLGGTNTAVTAWGAEAGIDNGFQAGETFTWKVWRISDGATVDMTATYHPSFPSGTSGTYATNGMSGILTLSGSYTPISASSVNLSFTLLEPDSISVSETLSDYSGFGVSAVGASDGSINLTVSGGTPPYAFIWSNFSTAEDLLGVPAGLYDVQILDANGCTFISSYTLTEPSGAVLQASGLAENASCYSMCDGSIDLTISGSQVPYSVLWSNGETTEDLANLCSGTYSVSIEEANSGAGSSTMPWTFTNTGANHNIFVGLGVVTINNSPIGVGDYIGVFYDSAGVMACGGYVLWEGNPNGTAVTVWGSEAGADNGFQTGEAFTWKVWKATDGAIVDMTPVYMTIGMPNLGTYATLGLSGLSSLTGTYTPTTGTGTTLNLSFNITQPDDASISAIVTDASTSGGSDGSIDITVSGGTPPYTFVWPNNATSEDISGLVAGFYNLIVYDANSCYYLDTFEVAQPTCISTMELTPGFLDFGSQEVAPTQDTLSALLINTGTCTLTIDSLFGLEGPFSLDTAALNLSGFFPNLTGVSIPPGDTIPIPVILNQYYTAGAYTDTLNILNDASLPASLNNGLVAQYMFSGGAQDGSDNGYHGTVNGATLTNDRFGNLNSAYSFDGNDYISISSSFILHQPIDASISFWMKKGAGSNQQRIFWSKLNNSDNNRFNCYTAGTVNSNIGFNMDYREANTSIHGLCYEQVTPDLWHHIVINRIGNLYTVYRDNASVSSISDNFPNLPNSIGWIIGGLSPYSFEGVLDDIRIYNRALFETEIQALYNEGTGANSIAQIIVHAQLTDSCDISTNVSMTACESDQIIIGGMLAETSGTYYDTLTAANGCDSVVIVDLTIYPNPVVDLGPDVNLCLGNSVVLDPGYGWTSYLWSTAQTTQTILASEPGVYIVEVFDINACGATDIIEVFNSSFPTLSLSGIDSFYCNETLTPTDTFFTTPSGGVLTGAGLLGNVFFPSSVQAGPIVFTYSYTDQYGCSDTLAITTQVGTVVSFVGLLPEYCAGDPASLLIPSPVGGYFSGDGIIGNEFIPDSAGTGTYPISYYFTDTMGCVNEAGHTAVVYPTPGDPVVADVYQCGVGPVTFSATGAAGNFHWYNSPAGPIVYTGVNFTTPYLSASDTFWVQSASQTICEGDLLPVVATIDTSEAQLTLSDSCLNLPTVMQYLNSSMNFSVTNAGCDALQISSMYTTDQAFQLTGTGFAIPHGATEQFMVTFAPQQAGTYTDTIFIQNNITDTFICLNAVALDAPAMSVGPTFLNANLNCGGISAEQIVIYNNGLGSLDYQFSISSSTWISSQSVNGMIVGSDTDTLVFDINSSGLSAGIYSVNITISSNDPQNPVSIIPVTLTVSGNSGISLSAAALNFGSIMQYTSTTQSLYIENTGCNVLNVSNISSTNADFASAYSSQLVGPYSSELLTITFTPSLPGQYTDTLHIYNNAVDTFVVLSGYADGAPVMAYSTTTQSSTLISCNDTDSMDYSFMNNGLGDLTYSVSNIASLPSWVVLQNTSGTIVPGDSANLSCLVNADGLSSGTYQAQITMSFNDPITPSLTLLCNIVVVGSPEIAISADTLLFDTTMQWTGDSKLLIIDNDGCAPLEITGIVNSLSEFAPALTSLTVQPFGQSYLEVYFNPVTSAATSFSDTLHLITNAGNVEVNLLAASIGAPIVSVKPTSIISTVGCMETATGQFTISNTGTSPLNFATSISPAQVTVNGTVWLLASTATTIVGPGDSTIINLAFNATGINVGMYETQISIATNDPLTPGLSVPVSMIVTGFPEIDVTPLAVEFDSVNLSTTANNYVSIYNLGCDTLFLDSIRTSIPEFTLTQPSLNYILPGDYIDVNLWFTPTLLTHYWGTLQVYNNDVYQEASLHGYGLGDPNVTVSADTLWNEAINCNELHSSDLIIRNEGQGILNFSIIEQSNYLSLSTTSGTLLAGDTVIVTVTFNATDLPTGTHSYNLTINTNDLLTPYFYIDTEFEVLNANTIFVDLGSDSTTCAIPVAIDAGLFSSYNWSTGSVSQTITAYSTGVYSVSVTDANGCHSTDQVEMTIHPLPSVSFSGLDASYCLDISFYPLTGSPAGGIFSGNGISGNTFVPYTAGVGNHTINYSYVDAHGCANSANQTTSVIQSTPVSIIGLASAYCFNAQIVTISGSPSGGQLTGDGIIGNTYNPASNGPGIFDITYNYDDGQCTNSIVYTVEVGDSINLDYSVSDINCNGENTGAIDITVSGGTTPYAYTWGNGSTNEDQQFIPAGNYSLTVSDQTGCAAAGNITVTEADAIATTQTLTNPLCPGSANGSILLTVSGGVSPYSFSWGTGATSQSLGSLASGSYSLTITDAASCSIMRNFNLNDPAAMTINPTITHVNCYGANDGSISVEVFGGTGVVSYLWSNGGTTSAINNLAAGTYSLTVTDANGCSTNAQYLVDTPSAIAVNATVTDANYPGMATGEIVLSVTGGVAPYAYSWDNGSTINHLTSLLAGIYPVNITDANNCSFVDSFLISEPATYPEIEVLATSLSGHAYCGEAIIDSFLISNTGTDTLEVSIAESLNWFFVPEPNVSIAPAQSLWVEINYDGGFAFGTHSGNIEINSNDLNATPIILPVELLIECAFCDLSTTSLNFATTVEGFSATDTFILKNIGNMDMDVSSMTTTGNAFIITTPFTGILLAGASVNITVAFSPASDGSFSGSLNISSNSNTPCSAISLSGIGLEAIHSWELLCGDPDFGFTDINTGGVRPCTIHNTGTLPVTITDCAITDTAFSLSLCSLTVAPGVYQPVDIYFNPTEIAPYAGQVGFTDATGLTSYVSVFGQGYYQSQAPVISFSTAANFGGTTGVWPTIASSSTWFQYAVVYTDADNNPPMLGYPKLGIDNNYDTDFSDPMDEMISLAEADPTDQDYTDGKTYLHFTQLGLGDHGYQFFAYDSLGNMATSANTGYVSDPTVSNDLLDLSIYANDIIFSNPSPDVGEQITITANIHNYTDYPGNNVKVYFVIDSVIVDSQMVSTIQPQTSTSVSIQHYFSYWDYYPVKVWVDPLNTIQEDNELNNFAIRPITVGNVPLPQILFVSTALSPSTVNAGTVASIHYSGQVQYDALAGNQPCVGAFITMTNQQTGQVFTTHSVSGGYFNIYFPAPYSAGTCTINSTVTDYTLNGQSGNEYLTVTPVLGQVNLNQFVDLRITNSWLQWGSGCAVEGSQVSINGSFTNQGNLSASNFFVVYYVDNVATDSILVPYLGAGQSMGISKSMTLVEGTHSFAVTLDATNSVAELNESNNYASNSKYIYPSEPDLAPTDIVFSDNSPYIGQTINIDFIVNNLQCATSDTVTALILDAITGDVLGTLAINSVGGLSQTSVSMNHSFATAGFKFIKITVDSYNSLFETNESNQVMTKSLYVEQSLPELSASNISVSNIGTMPGDNMFVVATIANTGDSAAHDFYVSFAVDGQNIADSVWIDTLLAYDSRIVESGLFTRDSCPQTVTVVADAGATVYELNEANNIASRELGYGLNAKKYYITNSSYSRLQVDLGSSLNAKAYLKNNGEFTSQQVPVSYFADGAYIGTDVVPFVSPGGQVLTHIDHEFLTPGNHEILVKVDFIPPDSIFFCESNEGDNSHVIYVKVKAQLPDLVVYSEHISPSTINPDPGDAVEITTSFWNIGNVDAGPFTVEFFINDNPLGSPVQVSGLLAHEDSSVPCTQFYIPDSAGVDIIKVKLDAADLVDEEEDYANNVATRALVVGLAPDFTFEPLCLSMSNPNPNLGDFVLIYPKIRNDGSEAGLATVNLYSVIGFDTTFVGATSVFLGANSGLSNPIFVQWTATATLGEIYMEIVEVTPQEYNPYNNSCSSGFGNLPLNVWLTTLDSAVCPGGAVSLVAHTVDGTGNNTYSWWAGTTLIYQGPDSVLLATISENTVFIVEVTDGISTVSDTIELNVHPEIEFTVGAAQPSCFGTSDGSIDIIPALGAGSFTYEWSNGETSEDLANLMAGTYSYTLTDIYTCQSMGQVEVVEPAELMLNEDIYYPNQPNIADGAILLNVSGGTAPYNYFWSNSETTSYIYTLSAAIYAVTVSDNNACTRVDSFQIVFYDQQHIPLHTGWNLISTYLQLVDSNVVEVCSGIVSNLALMKDDGGSSYWPFFEVDQIHYFELGEGYQMKMNVLDTLHLIGNIAPDHYPFPIDAGWNMIGYLRTDTTNCVDMFSAVANYIILVKNEDGQTYWPFFALNGIDDMYPGKGYQLNALSSFMFSYPLQTSSPTKSDVQVKHPQHFKKIQQTGNNMTLGLMLEGLDARPGDEIAVFSTSGLLVGAGAVNGSFSSIAIWGNDDLTDEVDGLLPGEEFEIRIWDSQTGQERSLVIDEWIEGDGSYEINKIAVAGISNFQFPISGFALFQNTPNPFTNETEFSFYLPQDCKVDFDIFNIVGEKVAVLISEEMMKGKHSLVFNSQDLAAGTYYYRLKTPDFEETKKMVVVKR
ncbi:MAG: PKD domain-containing protein [Bacteroidales bacterium]|nr:PKD domain-containing protein [Bacteroidales bacterium]MCF8454781.1 PKD domain-containing protein [Bacteroidales bacterium]